MAIKTCADYIADAKAKAGDPKMPETKLSQVFAGGKYSQSVINRAKRGQMNDPFAYDLAQFLGIEPGEVLMVARAARERDPVVRDALLAYVGKILRLTASKASAAAVA